TSLYLPLHPSLPLQHHRVARHTGESNQDENERRNDVMNEGMSKEMNEAMKNNREPIPDLSSVVRACADIDDVVKYYWGYPYQLGRQVIVPEMMAKGMFRPGDAVADIGCGEAGVLEAFVQAGAVKALGTDIADYRLDKARIIADLLGIPLTLSKHDILFSEPKDEWRNAYDLVLLRDVIEHLDDATLALSNIRKILAPGGRVHVTFPPYSSPFGGHQQLLENVWGVFPYLHMLPKALFARIARTGKQAANAEEVERLASIRFSAKKMLKAARDAGYEVVDEEYYLLRPVFKMKFGLPTIRITALKRLPFVRSLFSLEAAYVLRLPS
ncbi:MAG: class I SAM-dependent methyltransferase, partial [Candidatus Kapaibacterium sp.]